MVELARHYGKSVAQFLLRWDLQNGVVTIPKSTKPHRIAENADVFDFELTAEDMARISTLNENLRIGPETPTISISKHIKKSRCRESSWILRVCSLSAVGANFNAVMFGLVRKVLIYAIFYNSTVKGPSVCWEVALVSAGLRWLNAWSTGSNMPHPASRSSPNTAAKPKA